MITLTEGELRLALTTHLVKASRCVLVLDIVSPFLEEALPPLDELTLVVDALNEICRELAVYVEPLIGSRDDAIARIPLIRSLSQRGLLLDQGSVPRVRVHLYTQGLRNTFEAEIVNLQSIGTTIIYSIPRTCDIPPILTPSALYAYYIVDSNMRDLIKQGFIATHYNIALILKTAPLDLAILSFAKAISGDGPIYGYVERLATRFLIGSAPYVDTVLALCLGFSLDDIYFIKILKGEHSIVKMLQLASHSTVSNIACRKLRRHSFYPYHRRIFAREQQRT